MGFDRRAGRGVEHQVRRRINEVAHIPVPRARQGVVFGEPSEELHPQRVPADQTRDNGGCPQPGRYRAGAVNGRVRAAGRYHHQQDQARQGGIGQQFGPGEQLRGGQQAQPPAIRRGAAATGEDPQQGMDHQRRQSGELEVVVADAGIHQGRGEPVEGSADGRRAYAGSPPAQHPQQAGRRPGESQCQHERQADLRPGPKRHRGKQDGRQQERRVPHQVHALRCVQRGADQGGQMSVLYRRGCVMQVPDECGDVMDIAGRRASGRVGPQLPGQVDGASQVTAGDQPLRVGGAQPPPGAGRRVDGHVFGVTGGRDRGHRQAQVCRDGRSRYM